MQDYRRLFARNKLILVLGLLVGAGAAIAYSFTQERVYQASASVAFSDLGQQTALVGGSAATQQTPAALAAESSTIVNRPEVVARAGLLAGDPRSPDALRAAISAAVETSSNLVVVSAKASTAVGAARLATAAATAAADQTNNATRSQFVAYAKTLQRQIRRIPNNAANIITRQNDQANLSRLQTLGIVARPATVTLTARVPGAPSSPQPVFNGLLGGVLGLMVAFGVAFARETLDQSLRSAAEVSGELGLPMLAEIGDKALGKTPFLNGTADDDHARLAIASFGILRRNVELLHLEEAPRVVAVTSAAPEEGKTTVAVSLACAFASVGRRTLLLEADLRRPALAERLGLPATPGLCDFLAGSASPKDIVRVVNVPTPGHDGLGPQATAPLAVILAGQIATDPDELLASDRMRDSIGEMSAAYEAVVVDTSPVLPVADTLEILPLADAFLVCVRPGRSRRIEVAALCRTLGRLPDRPAGGVLTGVTRREHLTSEYYSYYRSMARA